MNRGPLQKNVVFTILFLLIIFPFQGYSDPHNLRVHFINVGYGDAILLEMPDETVWLIDSGDEAASDHLIEHLNTFNVQKIDTAIITHPHQNHFQGFFALLEQMSIGRVFINGDPNAEEGFFELLEEFEKKQIPVKVLKQGDLLGQLPVGVRIKILHPQGLTGTPNGNSIVMWLEHKNVKMLFTADIEPGEQEELLTNYPKVKHADLVQVPHHGGNLSGLFFESFVSTIFVVSTGANQWGFPSKEDLQRLRGTVYRTDQQGDIVLGSDGFTIDLFHE